MQPALTSVRRLSVSPQRVRRFGTIVAREADGLRGFSYLHCSTLQRRRNAPISGGRDRDQAVEVSRPVGHRHIALNAQLGGRRRRGDDRLQSRWHGGQRG
jgi:hypothetical protein